MELNIYLVYSLVAFIVIALVVSFAALGVSMFKDNARENRLKRLEDEVTSLRLQIDILKAEGLLKDEKIECQAKQIIQLQGQIDDKELQIVELRRQITRGT